VYSRTTPTCVVVHVHAICFLFVQVQDFTDKVNFYVMNAVTFFKSMWPEVKCNAALFVGKSPDVTAVQSLVPRSHISMAWECDQD